MRGLWFDYLPYGVVDVLLTLIIIAQIVQGRADLIWACVPTLILGIFSFNRKLRSQQDESGD